MKISKIRNTCVAALLLLALSLTTACGGGGDGKENGGGGSNATPTGDGTFVYVPEYLSVDSGDTDLNSMGNAQIVGETIYFSSYGKIGEREPEEGDPKPGDENYYEGMYDLWGNSLYKMGVDGKNLQKLDIYKPTPLPEGAEGDVNMSGFAVDADENFWISEYMYMYHTTESGEWVDDGQTSTLKKYDATGTELQTVDLAQYQQDGQDMYVGSLVIDGGGNLCFTDGNQNVIFLDKDGKLLFKLQEQNGINQIIHTADGGLAVSAWGESGMTLKKVDIAAKAFGKSIDMPYNAYNVYDGGGEYDVYYGSDMTLYGGKFDGSEPVKLLNWLNADIDSSNMRSMSVLQDGRILCATQTYNESEGRSTFELAMLTKKPSSEVAQKKIITLAALWLDYSIRGEIIEFNKKNGEYRIEVTDYSEFNTEDDYTAGLTKLNTEIITGNVPDILCTDSQIPVQTYASKGLLEDLYPYIDADEEIGGRDGLVKGVISAMEVDGKLYEAATTFSVFTVLGAPSVVGEEMGWTMNDLNAALADHPEAKAFANMTQDTMLYYSCVFGMSNYVNWETGECRFNSDGFIKMLELAATYPKEISYEEGEYVDDMTLIREGKVLLYPTSISDFSDFQMYKASFGGTVAFKGFPTESGTGGSTFMINSGLAMSSKCAEKDGAWQFIRMLFTEEYQEQNSWWGLPTNQKRFDAKIAEAMEPEMGYDENGNEIEVPKYTWGWEGGQVEIYAATQEEVDQIMNLIDSVDSTMRYDESMLKIIQEGAAPFFAGQKSAKDAASVIQSRVNIYVNEQR